MHFIRAAAAGLGEVASMMSSLVSEDLLVVVVVVREKSEPWFICLQVCLFYSSMCVWEAETKQSAYNYQSPMVNRKSTKEVSVFLFKVLHVKISHLWITFGHLIYQIAALFLNMDLFQTVKLCVALILGWYLSTKLFYKPLYFTNPYVQMSPKSTKCCWVDSPVASVHLALLPLGARRLCRSYDNKGTCG